MFGRFLKEASGATAVEYGIILAVMTLTIIGAIGEVGGSVSSMWGSNADQVRQALED